MLWVYRAVFKQTAGGGGSIIVNITMQERSILIAGLLGPNDYAANRTVTAWIRDTGDVTINYGVNASADNVAIPFPWLDVSGVGNFDGPEAQMQYPLGASERMKFQAASLVQNEELTLAIRMWIKTTKPVITTTGSGGTVTTTTTYDKVA